MVKFKSDSIQGISGDFGWSLLFSLALHAMLLWQAPPPVASAMLPQAALPAATLNASLRRHSEAQPPATATASLAQPRGVPQPTGSSTPQPVAEAPSQATAEVTVALPGTGEAGVDPHGLRQYRLSLAIAARRFKLYPAQAREQAWSGTAEVMLAVAANGVTQPVQLLRTSGYPVLDAAALEMIDRAAPQVALPPSLRGRSFNVTLPVAFEFTDE